MTDYSALTKELSKYLAPIREELPDVMAGFSAMAKGATKSGVLDAKTKELIALAIGVAGHCKGCIGFHTQALVRLGATREEIMETLGMAIYMGGGPALMYAAEAVQAFEEAQKA